MATVGYSGTPLVKKLGFREGSRAALVGAPPGFSDGLIDLPEGVRFVEPARRPLDLVLLFVRSSGELEKGFARLTRRLAPAGMLWVAWPKRASKVATDVTEDVVREVALPRGLVDVKVCAIDETWSGLKLVIRRELRTEAAR